jgi:hypothetical protein
MLSMCPVAQEPAAVYVHDVVWCMSSSLLTLQPLVFFPLARQLLGGLGLLMFRGLTITLFLNTSHSVRLLWTSDQSVAETAA